MEVFGTISAAASLAGFLLKVIDDQAGHLVAFIEWKHRIRYCRSLLDTQNTRLRAWSKTWQFANALKTDYVLVWGQDGFDEVKRKLDCIAYELREVQSLLEGHAVLTDKEKPQWPPRYKKPDTTQDAVFLGIARRILFSVFKEHILESRLERLKNVVDDLFISSRLLHSEANSAIGEQEMQGKAFEELHKFELSFRRLWSNLDTARSRFDQDLGVWSLLLVPPDDSRYDLDQYWLEHCTKMRLNFLYSSAFIAQQQGIEIEAVYSDSEDASDDASLYCKLSCMADNAALVESDAKLQDSVKHLLSMIAEQGPELQTYLRKTTCTDRARIALATATWIIPFLGSEWVTAMCSCCVRHVRFTDSHRLPAFCRDNCHERMACFDKAAKCRRHLLLGLILCELAIAQPVHVRTTEHAVTFHIQDSTESLNTAALLLRVRRATSSRCFTNAASYCFEWDRKTMTKLPFAAQHLHEHVKRVVEPLQQYYKTVATHYDTQSVLQKRWQDKVSQAPKAEQAVTAMLNENENERENFSKSQPFKAPITYSECRLPSTHPPAYT